MIQLGNVEHVDKVQHDNSMKLNIIAMSPKLKGGRHIGFGADLIKLASSKLFFRMLSAESIRWKMSVL